jgi:hypothetical protein
MIYFAHADKSALTMQLWQLIRDEAEENTEHETCICM